MKLSLLLARITKSTTIYISINKVKTWKRNAMASKKLLISIKKSSSFPTSLKDKDKILTNQK